MIHRSLGFRSKRGFQRGECDGRRGCVTRKKEVGRWVRNRWTVRPGVLTGRGFGGGGGGGCWAGPPSDISVTGEAWGRGAVCSHVVATREADLILVKESSEREGRTVGTVGFADIGGSEVLGLCRVSLAETWQPEEGRSGGGLLEGSRRGGDGGAFPGGAGDRGCFDGVDHVGVYKSGDRSKEGEGECGVSDRVRIMKLGGESGEDGGYGGGGGGGGGSEFAN
ncbi:hypothetical protein BDD12DRAFT_810928 [Trichophaea hybrida]|nr:hypothetical protein BDD12DRAFT_810928 [Trichophaea hybrida]